MEEYRCFTRRWWKDATTSGWPNGLEPHCGKKHYACGTYTLEEAREKCREYNDTHDPGKYSVKMEFERA